MVTAIDLTSAGTNPASADSVQSFEQYNQPLMDCLAKQQEGVRIVLVGHSIGGVSVAYASEAFPQLIAVAVYVSAVMPRGGNSLQREKEIMQPDEDIVERLEFSFADTAEDLPTSFKMPEKSLKDYFYNKTSSLDATLGSLLARPFPTMAMSKMDLETTEERYGVVPRVYVKTGQDKVFSLSKQEELIARSPPRDTFFLEESDHSPFFCATEKLHQLLLDVALAHCRVEEVGQVNVLESVAK